RPRPRAVTGAALDLRAAVRRLRRRAGFATTVVAILAVTIGATTAAFAIVRGVLIRTLPFAEPEELVHVVSVRPDLGVAPFTLPEYMDYRQRTRSLSGLAAYAGWSASLVVNGAAERLSGARLSANAFDVLGVAPSVGRLLHDSDDHPDAPPVVL